MAETPGGDLVIPTLRTYLTLYLGGSCRLSGSKLEPPETLLPSKTCVSRLLAFIHSSISCGES